MKNGDKRYLVTSASAGRRPAVTVLFNFRDVGEFVYDEYRLGREVVSIQAQEWVNDKWVNYN